MNYYDLRKSYNMLNRKLGTLKGDLRVIEQNNKEFNNIKINYDKVVQMEKDAEDYMDTLKIIYERGVIEGNEYKKRRIDFLEKYIGENLAEIFPDEEFQCKINYEKKNGKAKASLTLIDRNGEERLPRMSEGKLCRQLVSYSACIAMCECTDNKKLYMDEAFYASSPENLAKISGLLKRLIKEDFQIILIAQTDDIYKDIPHREITLEKDLLENKVNIVSIIDY